MQCLFPLFNVQFDTVFLVVTDFPVLANWLCPEVATFLPVQAFSLTYLCRRG